MEILKKLFNLFRFRKRKNYGNFAVLGHTLYLNCHPFDLIEDLSIAIVLYTKKAYSCSTEDILLYELRYPQGNFIGSFYGVEKDGKMFGNIVGQDEIICFNKSNFFCTPTQKLIIPLANRNRLMYGLECTYKHPNITVKHLSTFRNEEVESIVHDFSADTTVKEAMTWAKQHNYLDRGIAN